MENENQGRQHRDILIRIARRAMADRGLNTDFPAQVIDETSKINKPQVVSDIAIRDMRELMWCSIDNDSSLDLDQLSVAQALPDGSVKILVAIADVNSVASKNSQLDIFAAQNTLSVYTPAIIFPMLPEKLSTGLTSLNYNSERLSFVTEIIVKPDGLLDGSDVYCALVLNKAKLAYNSVAAWLDGTGEIPEAIKAVPGLDANIRIQLETAKKLKKVRHENGALDFLTFETSAHFEGDKLTELRAERTNCAKDIIEDFMIAVNGATARFLETKKFPSIRRVVHTPKSWDRIVVLAKELGASLPLTPDSKALELFLTEQKEKDAEHYPDLSLSIIKLLGPGEYCLEIPGGTVEGHFGLAVKDYTHSTAPNRRYPDLITQRLLKAAISGAAVPYSNEELKELALHCTQKEDDVKKVERQVDKSAAAILLSSMIGMTFDAIVTGASAKGTWARIIQPHAEGRVTGDIKGLLVGNKIKVTLISTDVEKGFIDFKIIS
jgi:exoribonuclease-2